MSTEVIVALSVLAVMVVVVVVVAAAVVVSVVSGEKSVTNPDDD